MNTDVTLENIKARIFLIRGHRILLDSDLAQLYGVETKNLNKAVKRNIERFPEDFMFQLSTEELKILRFQSGTSKLQPIETKEFIQAEQDPRGGRRTPPYAFTQEGVAMLSGVLQSPQAVQVKSVFDAIRALVSTHSLPRKRILGLNPNDSF